MNVEFFIHGVPKGHDLWGAKEESPYFETLYDNCTDEQKFLIQPRAVGGKFYCYYNYLVYKDVVDLDGRSGSYIGITLRFDAYCKDAVNVYRILDILYHTYILGSIVKDDGNKIRYVIHDFSSRADEIKKTEETAFLMIQNCFSNNCFVPLDNTFIKSTGNTPLFNLYDCTQENILAAIKQYGKVAISPFYPSKKDAAVQQQFETQSKETRRQYETRLSAENEAHNKEKEELSSVLSSTKNSMSQLQEELSKKDKSIQSLNDSIVQLKDDVKKLGECKNIEQLIAPIEIPISHLNDAFQKIKLSADGQQQESEEKKSHVSFAKIFRVFIPLLNFILILFIIYLLIFPQKSGASISLFSNNDQSLSAKVNSLEQENKRMQTQLASYQATEDTAASNAASANSGVISSSGIQLKVKDYLNGPLKKHATYEITAVNGSDNGIWEVKGGNKTATKVANIIKIIPTGQTVTITYSIGNEFVKKEFSVE